MKCKAAEKKAAEYACLCMEMHFSMLETMRTNMTETVKIHENMTQTGRSVLETMMMKSTTRTMETMETKETMETIETIVHHEDDGDDTTGKYKPRPRQPCANQGQGSQKIPAIALPTRYT